MAVLCAVGEEAVGAATGAFAGYEDGAGLEARVDELAPVGLDEVEVG